MTTPITFTVEGIAQPQGSARAFMPKGRGRFPVVTSDNPKLKGWRREVAKVAQRVYRGPALEGPMEVSVTFFLPAPKSMKRMKPHTTRPDCDKLARAIGDALAGVIYRDDAQIIDWHPRKYYADAGTLPRAVITVTPLTAEGTLFS